MSIHVMSVFVARLRDQEQIFVIVVGEERFGTAAIQFFHRGDDLTHRQPLLIDVETIHLAVARLHVSENSFNVFLDALAIHHDFANRLVELLNRHVHMQELYPKPRLEERGKRGK